jgi:hypothetical protein
MALNRWTEEARVLDGDSMHDCIIGKITFQASPSSVFRFFFQFFVRVCVPCTTLRLMGDQRSLWIER